MLNITNFLKVISDKTRLKIIKLLWINDLCVCELVEILNKKQPCISQHLTILKNANLLKTDKDGLWIIYSLNKNEFAKQLKLFNEFLKMPLNKLNPLKSEYQKLQTLKNRKLLCKNTKIKKRKIKCKTITINNFL